MLYLNSKLNLCNDTMSSQSHDIFQSLTEKVNQTNCDNDLRALIQENRQAITDTTRDVQDMYCDMCCSFLFLFVHLISATKKFICVIFVNL